VKIPFKKRNADEEDEKQDQSRDQNKNYFFLIFFIPDLILFIRVSLILNSFSTPSVPNSGW